MTKKNQKPTPYSAGFVEKGGASKSGRLFQEGGLYFEPKSCVQPP